MRRVSYVLLFICLAVTGICPGQQDARKAAPSDSKPASRKACPFSIVGVWKSEATSQTNPIFFAFAPTGWVTVLGHTEGALPQDFDMMAQARYKLDDPASPTRIEFTASTKNDTFPRGTSSLQIVMFSENNFTVADITTGHRSRWDRVQARRYFLTFAARGGSASQPGPAFAIWTTLDGQKTEVEALGVHLKTNDSVKTPIFEPVPAESYSEFEADSGSDPKVSASNSNVMMRLELSESEFYRTHKIFETWEGYVKAKALPNADPFVNAMEFLTKVAESINQCDDKIRLHKQDPSKPDDLITRHKVTQRPLEYIRLMRKKNDQFHVSDATFPRSWRPVVELAPQD